MTPSSNAASPTLRVIGPIVSSDGDSGRVPRLGTRPLVGLSPTVPHHADGLRIEPPVSVPIAASTSPAATAAHEPEDEPPVARVYSIYYAQRAGRHGSAEVARYEIPSIADAYAAKRPAVTFRFGRDDAASRWVDEGPQSVEAVSFRRMTLVPYLSVGAVGVADDPGGTSVEAEVRHGG